MKLYREFFSYVIPSLLAFALSGVYSIVDGFFVGNIIGDAVHYSIRLASGKKEEAKRYTDGTVVLLLAASLVSTLVFYLAAPAVLTALGTSGQILELGISYLRIIVLGSVFQIFGTLLSYILVYAEPVFLFLLLLLLPRMAGLSGVWLSIPLAQSLTFVTALVCRLWASSRSSSGIPG